MDTNPATVGKVAHRRFPGSRTFGVVWLGQVVSLLGSSLTGFALAVWLFDQTGSAMPLALVALATAAPRLVISPIAGSLVDRVDRRLVMLAGDSGSALCTLALALLFIDGRLALWHILAATAASAACSAFQSPAYSAAVPLLVAREDLGRANGLVGLSNAIAEILSPAIAGALVLTIGVGGVMLIDVATFLVAAVTLLAVRFPAVEGPAASHASFWRDTVFGWRYLAGQTGLVWLLGFTVVVNFIWGMVAVLSRPLVLSFASAAELGVVLTVAGCGVLVGGAALSAWGGPRRKIDGVLGFELLSGVSFMLMGLRPSLYLIAFGAFVAHLTLPLINGCRQTIIQTTVPHELQGRVFATWQMVSGLAAPVAFVLAGVLADGVFAPLLVTGGPLADSLGSVLGVGAGRGIGLLFVAMGVAKLAVGAAGYLEPRVRRIG